MESEKRKKKGELVRFYIDFREWGKRYITRVI